MRGSKHVRLDYDLHQSRVRYNIFLIVFGVFVVLLLLMAIPGANQVVVSKQFHCDYYEDNCDAFCAGLSMNTWKCTEPTGSSADTWEICACGVGSTS